jgi:hypothetical protein
MIKKLTVSDMGSPISCAESGIPTQARSPWGGWSKTKNYLTAGMPQFGRAYSLA